MKIRLIIFLLITTGVGVVSGILLPKQYEATVVTATVSDEGGASRLGGLGAIASQYSGLASLAGVSLPNNGGKRDETLAVMQSEYLTERYIREHGLLPELLPSREGLLFRIFNINNGPSGPTLWKANQYFNKKVRRVIDEKRTGLVYLRILWKDPTTAALWANDLVKLTNNYLREKAIQDAERDVAYLTEQGLKTDSVDARKVIYSLMEEEMNKAMLARGHEEYALKIIDPAVPPEKPASFGAGALGMFGFFGGLFVFFMWVFGRKLLQSN